MKYSRVISLGANCNVALDLERIGYRVTSSPFDWVISNFDDVVNLIDNRFEDMLILGNIIQDKEHPNVYHDTKTGLDHYHDFKENDTIEVQFEAVKQKYSRRIERFLTNIQEPTLFIRLIRNEEDYKWITTNIDRIGEVLTLHGKVDSKCVFIAGEELKQNDFAGIIDFYSKNPLRPIIQSRGCKNFISQNVKIGRIQVLYNRAKYYRMRLQRC